MDDLISRARALYGEAGGNAGFNPFGGRYADSLSSPMTLKGMGYFGAIPAAGGQRSTEISSSFEHGGKTIEHPLMVPTLTAEELKHLLSGAQPTPEIYDKAQSWALQRLKAGLNPFAGPQDLRYPLPK